MTPAELLAEVERHLREAEARARRSGRGSLEERRGCRLRSAAAALREFVEDAGEEPGRGTAG